MKTRILKNLGFVFLLFGCLLIVSCSNTRKLNSNANPSTEVGQQKPEDIYGLVVSFYSPGNGIDQRAKSEYIKFLSSNYPALAYEKTSWGREGEIDFCFLLDELTEIQKSQFIKKSKELLSNSKKIHIYENKACTHK